MKKKNRKNLIFGISFLIIIVVLIVGGYIYLSTKAKNSVINYGKLNHKLSSGKRENYVTKCDCGEEYSETDFNDSDCTTYKVSNSEFSRIITKLKSTKDAEVMPTGSICSVYTFSAAINKETVIDGFVGDNKKSILVGYEDEGYAYNYEEDVTALFENLIKGKKGIQNGLNYQYTEKKPVLYLYPKKDKTKITVTFEKPKQIKISYPKYKDKWVVTANKNGNLTDKKGNTYYALYWEEKKSRKIDFKQGYYVEKKDAVSFLEDKLKYIGLNERESNEFIMYWLPVLEKNKKSVVYFEMTEERQEYNKLNIEPEPDSILRFSMHVKKVDKKPKNLERQHIKHFNRKGFAAVEWGGVIHKSKK